MPYGTPVMAAAPAELAVALRRGPFHVALRAAIAARGLSLQRVQHHLARRGVNVGVTSLSYWQQGARRPRRDESLRAVRALEEILQLPGESLIRLLSGPPAGAGLRRPMAARFPSRIRGPLEELLTELESPFDGALGSIGHHERVRIGAHRELLAVDSQLVVRAHTPGVDRYVAVHHGDPGCAPEQMSVHALENCRTGRVRRHRETGVLVAELLFDTRLRTGETHVFRFAFEDGTAGATGEYSRGFGLGGGQYVLQVRFAEEAVPLRCHRFSQRPAATAPSGLRELRLSRGHRCVHLVEPEVRAGHLGIRWDWV
ncbi:hypothetical protein [Streptomyces sp. NPDC050560]|uniref:hypothetical protein n=1 Tax=Streptomyces sp. NPDC050560 TaxID=3365630 RepID=UPI0037995594